MRRRWILAIPCVAALLIAFVPRPSPACGGPHFHSIDSPIVSIDQRLADLVTRADIDYAFYPRDEIVFLYPFKLARPDALGTLWALSYLCGGGIQYCYEHCKTPEQCGPDGPQQITIAPISSASFQQAIENGDWAQAEQAAAALVNQIIDMPAVEAAMNQGPFKRAVEFLELKPYLTALAPETIKHFFLDATTPQAPPPKTWYESILDWLAHFWRNGAAPSSAAVLEEARAIRALPRDAMEAYARAHPTSPRVASLRYVAIQEAMKKDIPNGWRETTQKEMPAEPWRHLEQLHEDWLAAYPKHPLTDLVRLSKLRLYYFQGRADVAWNLLLALYPQRLSRVLGEMRYLLKQHLLPPTLAHPHVDPVLLSALIPFAAVTPAQWSETWQLAEHALPAPWAVNLQERLLFKMAEGAEKGKPLPPNFPASPRLPSELAGQFRFIALMKQGDWQRALAQADQLKPNQETAPLQAKIYLHEHLWEKAAHVRMLPPETVRYLIAVLYPPDALQSLLTSPDAHIRRLVADTLAIRAAATGDWETGIHLLESHDATRVPLWQTAARLAADTTPDGQLVLAHFLQQYHGKLFYPKDRYWYRALFYRIAALTALPEETSEEATHQETSAVDPSLPWTKTDETDAILHHLTTSELFLAMQAYAAWLGSTNPDDSKRSLVIKEANKTFDTLLNMDYDPPDAWTQYLTKTDAAVTIRHAATAKRPRAVNLNETQQTPPIQVGWRFVEDPHSKKEDVDVQTRIVLVLTGGVTKEIDLGLYDGHCGGGDARTDEAKRDPRALLIASCWWGGAGQDLAVRPTSNKLVVRERWNDEGSGIGEWNVIKTLPIAPGSKIVLSTEEIERDSASHPQLTWPKWVQ